MTRIWFFFQSKILPLALGETSWRLSMLAILALFSRHYSISEFGAFNLGLILHQYAVMFTDFGTRSIGARLIATGQYPALLIVASVGRKRLRLFSLAFGVSVIYLMFTPSATGALLSFAIAALFVGMSHEWVFWAQERFWCFAGWRTLVGLLVFITVSIAVFAGGGIATIALAYAFAMAVGMALSWTISTIPFRWPPRGITSDIVELRWREISLLGFALIANQLFQTGDIMLLGILSDQHQLGIYGAAARLVLFLFGIYYLAIQALYPVLARRFNNNAMERKTIFLILGGAGLFGLGLATSIYPFLADLIHLAFGREMMAGGAPKVLGILIFVLPMELILGTWGMMATAAGLHRWALQITSFGALVNLLLNILLIPSKGAYGAALASLFSYILVVGLILLTVPNFFHSEPYHKHDRLGA